MRDLFAEYLAERPELLAFYAGAPKSLFVSAPKVSPWDPALVEALGEYQTSLGGRALFMGDEAVIITGQQPGLFTGPLYTIYKAATAVLLAKRVHDRFGVRCVPVFWVASDDHDFEESRVANVLTKNHELLELRYRPEQDVDGLPMYRVPLEASLHGLIDEMARQVAGSEFRGEVAAFLHESLSASGSFADWMARLMVRLFRDTPLVVFGPHLPAVRVVAAGVMEREIRDPLVSTMLLNRAGRRLRDLEFPQQVVKDDNECNFFFEVNGRRRKVVFEEDRYVLPEEEGVSYSVDEMVGVLEGAPERFTPNVALRCVVQQALFPAAAYVAGPSELAYWAELKPLFRHFGQEMPVIYPRASCILSDMKSKQLMERFRFGLDELTGPLDQLVERALQFVSRGPTREVLDKHRVCVVAALEPLVEELGKMGANMEGMVAAMVRRLMEEMDRIEVAVLKGDEEAAETARRQVKRLVTTFYPMRKPQERVYNVFSFVFEHGWGLVPRILRELDLDSFETKEVEL